MGTRTRLLNTFQSLHFRLKGRTLAPGSRSSKYLFFFCKVQVYK